MRAFVVLVILNLGLQSAGAIGGLSCMGDDAALKFDIASGLGRRIGAAFVNFRAELEIRVPTIPPDYRVLQMAADDVVQSWIDRDELKLDLYRERETAPFGYIELTIHTRSITEGTYVGGYSLTIYDVDEDVDVVPRTLEAHGNVTCLVE